MQIRKRFELRGEVQGVGFRPFVFRIASKFGISGFVCNYGDHVLIEAQGKYLKVFADALNDSHFSIESNKAQTIPQDSSSKSFRIINSSSLSEESIFLSPDKHTCNECNKELDNRKNFRFSYPFITCTNCGPRFSIIKTVPFDRIRTSMHPFAPCELCQTEYTEPENLRFHSQTNSCSNCGPRLSYCEDGLEHSKGSQAIRHAIQTILAGQILCVKGLGGYHLLADATNCLAISKLRKIKGRRHKPFAIMETSSEKVSHYCVLSTFERKLLESEAAPIVLLEKKPGDILSSEIAPGLKHIGVMLAYTGLHKIILEGVSKPIVASSANLTGQGIYYQEGILSDPACKPLTRFLLTHDREIQRPVEDSVIKPLNQGSCTSIRRSRGFSPQPHELVHSLKLRTLAMGSHLKNTFAIGKDNHVILSQHIGDLETYENYQRLKHNINDWFQLFNFQPQLIVHDLHPTYLSTVLAKELSQDLGIPSMGVQHHHAHIASCMAEHHLDEAVIGIALDGSGLGLDGTIWGGELFAGEISDLKRVGHLLTFKLIGGDVSTKEVWRIALALLWKSGIGKQKISSLLNIAQKDLNLLFALMETDIGGPLSSSCGRLFDGISALCGLCTKPSYEGHAAILLEQAAYQWKGKISRTYPVPLVSTQETFFLDWRPMLKLILEDMVKKVPVSKIACTFHHSLANGLLSACKKIRDDLKLSRVVLSGGVFANHLLLNLLRNKLSKCGFKVYFQQNFPSNDGGLSLGQIFLAAKKKG